MITPLSGSSKTFDISSSTKLIVNTGLHTVLILVGCWEPIAGYFCLFLCTGNWVNFKTKFK